MNARDSENQDPQENNTLSNSTIDPQRIQEIIQHLPVDVGINSSITALHTYLQNPTTFLFNSNSLSTISVPLVSSQMNEIERKWHEDEQKGQSEGSFLHKFNLFKKTDIKLKTPNYAYQYPYSSTDTLEIFSDVDSDQIESTLQASQPGACCLWLSSEKEKEELTCSYLTSDANVKHIRIGEFLDSRPRTCYELQEYIKKYHLLEANLTHSVTREELSNIKGTLAISNHI